MTKFRPRKGFGQNFLVNQGIIEKIIGIVQPAKNEKILEIGPGRGALTETLLSKEAEVYAIEIDRDLVAELQEKFGEFRNFHLFNEDFLKFDLQKIGNSQPVTVVGNIPYNITTPIIMRLLEFQKSIDFALLMVQWEVAKRIVATNADGKEYGSLSLAVQYYCEPKICFKVKSGSFFPVPTVDSAVIKLQMREKPGANVDDEQLLFQLTQQAFQFRRKMLSNCLKREPFDLSKEELMAIEKKSGIDLRRRGESLSLQEFGILCNAIKP